MQPYIKKIKKAVGRRIPENIKSVLRRMYRLIIPVPNPTIPAEELKIFELLKDSIATVFDVGSRDDLSFYRIHPNCSYHLFEPSTKAIFSLKQQIARLDAPNITLNEFGLSDKKMDDCVYYEDSQSFVINPFHKGFDTGIRYSLRTLDDYVAERNIPQIDFLKIDAEGLDYRIILGGIQTITTTVSYIQYEYWDGVQKFVDILGDTFNLYLMMEPQLLEAITRDVVADLTEKQKAHRYNTSIIPLDADLIDLIDRVLVPQGYGGNILGINKKISPVISQHLLFPIAVH